MTKNDRERLLAELARARGELAEAERLKDEAVALPVGALPTIDSGDVDELVDHYVSANPAAPDLLILDELYVGRATTQVNGWDGREAFAEKLAALRRARTRAHEVAAEIDKLTESVRREEADARDVIRRAQMRISRTQYPLDPDGTAPSSAPPAGGMLPSSTSTLARVVFWVLLGVAAVIDIVAFFQIIALVLRNAQDWMVWLGAIGFTAVALWLCHLAGQRMGFNKLVERVHPFRGFVVFWCLTAWATLGWVAFKVRSNPVDGTGATTTIDIDGHVITAPFTITAGNAMEAALIFGALYVGTGMVALVGSYLTYDPDGRAARQANRALELLRLPAAQAAGLLAGAEVLGHDLDAAIADLNQNYGADGDERAGKVASEAIGAAHALLRIKLGL